MSTVIVASTSSNQAKKIENFSGRTFADLKANSVFQSLFTAGQDVVLNPGNVNLVRDEAELPTGDFRVFLIQSKNKSGFDYDDASEVADSIKDALDDIVDKKGADDVAGLIKALKGAINNYFNIATTGEECSECAEALEDARDLEA